MPQERNELAERGKIIGLEIAAANQDEIENNLEAIMSTANGLAKRSNQEMDDTHLLTAVVTKLCLAMTHIDIVLAKIEKAAQALEAKLKTQQSDKGK